jgi:hypothetical protein
MDHASDVRRRMYIFFRKHPESEELLFYPVGLKDDADAVRNAEHNPGTVKVEDVEGRIVWQLNG